MLVRNVRDEDWEACLDVDLSFETEAAWQMDERQEAGEWHVAFREIRLPRTLRIQLATPRDDLLKTWQLRDRFWVAVEQRQVVGYLGLDIEQARFQARITDLAVAPDHRRKGYATALLQRATEWCVRQRLSQLVLVCPLKAFPAISFALKHRFAYCGYQDAYWPGQEVALFFRQRIR
ncbi:MAG: GNAT family N-acetyltransferase [Anaerolineae bacterium]